MVFHHNVLCRAANKKQIIFFVFVLIIIYTVFTALLSQLNIENVKKQDESKKIPEYERSIPPPPLTKKYILLWTKATASPSVHLGMGNKIFISRRCEWRNCFITDNRTYLRHYTEFDAIIFNGPQLNEIAYTYDFPVKRKSRQKYVFANIEAASNYPIRNILWNRFFNWTWTYRLDSDALWGYIAIRDANYQVIGPSEHIYWMKLDDMEPIGEPLKNELKSKRKAAAWFSSNCNTLSLRESMVEQIQNELQKYGLGVDIYGKCGKLNCSRNIMNECLNILKSDYYFYFAFENAFSEDYVTEKVLHALHSNTVPVVYGGANYSKFMPDGIYLDARKLGPRILAKKMNKLIKSPKQYQEFFKWKNHYSFHYRGESPDTDDYCRFCAMMNDEKLMRTTTTYHSFEVWWMRNSLK